MSAGLASSIRGRKLAQTELAVNVFVQLKLLAAFTFVYAAVYDVTVTALLSYKLAQSKKGFNAMTDGFIVRLLRLSLTTCALVRLRMRCGADAMQTTATAIALAVCVVVGDGSSGAQYACALTPLSKRADVIVTAFTYIPPRLLQADSDRSELTPQRHLRPLCAIHSPPI